MLLKLMVGYVYDAGCYSSWGKTKDVTFREDFERFGYYEDLWPDRDTPLPWRLTKEKRKFLDERMKVTIWPHYMDRLSYRGHSFWSKPNR